MQVAPWPLASTTSALAVANVSCTKERDESFNPMLPLYTLLLGGGNIQPPPNKADTFGATKIKPRTREQ